jgi:hypothetical protein
MRIIWNLMPLVCRPDRWRVLKREVTPRYGDQEVTSTGTGVSTRAGEQTKRCSTGACNPAKGRTAWLLCRNEVSFDAAMVPSSSSAEASAHVPCTAAAQEPRALGHYQHQQHSLMARESQCRAGNSHARLTPDRTPTIRRIPSSHPVTALIFSHSASPIADHQGNPKPSTLATHPFHPFHHRFDSRPPSASSPDRWHTRTPNK